MGLEDLFRSPSTDDAFKVNDFVVGEDLLSEVPISQSVSSCGVYQRDKVQGAHRGTLCCRVLLSVSKLAGERELEICKTARNGQDGKAYVI